MNGIIKQKDPTSKELKSNRRAHVGFVSALLLKIEGRRDGKTGLPGKGQDNRWDSPAIQREIDSYKETTSKRLLKVQTLLAADYARALELAHRVSRAEAKAQELLQHLPPKPQEEELNVVKRGEESLSTAQTRQRRLREHDIEKNKIEYKAEQILCECDEDIKELIALESKLTQNENAVELYLERMRGLFRQRIDIYWKAAYSVVGSSNEMPVVYGNEALADSDADYFSLHHDEHAYIANIIEKYKGGEAA